MSLPVDPQILPAFLLAMVFVELTPGPNMGYLAVLSASRGRLAGLSAVAGVTVGLLVYMLAAAAGVTEALMAFPVLFAILRWAGVVYILWLAFETWRGPIETSPGKVSGVEPRAYFWRGFLSNILNPKAAAFYVLMLPGFISKDYGDPLQQALTLGAIHVGISIVIHSAIVIGGSGLAAAAARSGLSRDPVLIRRAFAVSLVGVAIWLAISSAT